MRRRRRVPALVLLAVAGWVLLGATWLAGERPALAGAALLKTELEGIADYDLRVWRNAFPAGSATDFHRHAGHEVVYVLDGSMTVRIGDGEVPLETGELVYVPAGTAMQVMNRSAGGGEILVFMLAKKGAPLKRSHP